MTRRASDKQSNEQNHRADPLRCGLDIPQQRRVSFPPPQRVIEYAIEGDVIGEMVDAEGERCGGEQYVVEHEAGGDEAVVAEDAAVLGDGGEEEEEAEEAGVRRGISSPVRSLGVAETGAGLTIQERFGQWMLRGFGLFVGSRSRLRNS